MNETINQSQPAPKHASPISLLVVVLLIGLLAASAVFLLNTSQAKNRDSQRLVDIRRIQTALEFYKLQYGAYPLAASPLVLGSDNAVNFCDKESGGFISGQTACKNAFLSPVPSDPLKQNNYTYLATDQAYSLGFNTEESTILGAAGQYFAHSSGIDNSSNLK